jgi:hypothetical protein
MSARRAPGSGIAGQIRAGAASRSRAACRRPQSGVLQMRNIFRLSASARRRIDTAVSLIAWVIVAAAGFGVAMALANLG